MTNIEPINTDPPYGITLHHYDGEAAEVSFNSEVRSLWLKSLLAPLAIVWIFGVIGVFLSLAEGLIGVTLMLLVFCVGFYVFLTRVFSVTVDIKISPDTIEIHDTEYDRQLWGGFRLIDKTILGYSYRAKTESTGFALPNYKVSYKNSVSPAEVIVWLNDLVQDTGVEQVASPASGTRQQKF